jgi:O-antigen/teichoic acid export membrane protein
MRATVASDATSGERMPPAVQAPVRGQPRAGAVGLRARLVESLLALSTAAAVGQVANVAATLILARLLAPADFGAIGVATVALSAFTLLRNAFVYQTLIHRSHRVRESADQMILLSAALGLAVVVGAWFGAGWIGVFFHARASEVVLRLLSIGFLIGSLGAVPATLFEKDLRFRRKMWLESARPTVIAAVSVALAALHFGPASVGWGEVAGYSVWTIGLYRLSDYWPRPRWDPALLRELLDYGRYVFAGAFLVFLFTNLDNASVARILGARALGYYSFAFILAYFPAMAITGGVVSSLLLPVYARLQTDRGAQAQSLLSTMRYVSYYAAPICSGSIVLGPLLLRAVYGAKWAPAIISLQILCIYGFAHSYFTVIRNLCNGVGRARAFWYISALQLVVILPLFVVAPQYYGIAGTSLVFTVAKVIATLAAVAYALHQTGIEPWRLMRPVGTPVALSAAAGLAALLVGYATPGGHGLLRWAPASLSILTFVALYLAGCILFERSLITEIADLIGLAHRPALVALSGALTLKGVRASGVVTARSNTPGISISQPPMEAAWIGWRK